MSPVLNNRFKMIPKIHKTIFVYFDEFGAALTAEVIASILSRIGSTYKSYIRAVKPEVVKIVLDELHAPELQNLWICSSFLYLIFPNLEITTSSALRINCRSAARQLRTLKKIPLFKEVILIHTAFFYYRQYQDLSNQKKRICGNHYVNLK